MEKDCGEGENGNGFQLLGWSRIGGSKQGILEEHDFRPYSQDGEKELMMNDSERPLGVISGFSISDFKLGCRLFIV